ncbi:MAG: response regulator, partial [Caldilineaceae bacterium]|nr:response regulator [Caldilineaceae bacterium]
MEQHSTILIADDDPIAQETLNDLLTFDGYTTVQAMNGLEAVEMALQHTPDLVLLDVMMPGIDGFEVCRRLRAEPTTSGIPIIMLTALDDRSARLNGIESGADEFLTKPFDISELRTRVRTIARLNRYRLLQMEPSKFELLINRVSTGYLLVDDAGVIRYANPPALTYLGVTDQDPEAMIGRCFREVTDVGYQHEPEENWRNWPEPPPGDTNRFLIRPESSLQTGLWLSVQTVSRVPDGHEEVWLVSIEDATKDVTLQQETYSFQRMVAHKLRTPAGIVMLGTSMLASSVADMEPEEIAEMADAAYVHAKELSERISEVIRVADLGKKLQSDGPCSIPELASIFKRIAREKQTGGINVILASERDWDQCTLNMSSEAVETIGYEVIENACKHHPEKHPKLVLEISCAPEQRIQVKLIDDGVGVPVEVQ